MSAAGHCRATFPRRKDSILVSSYLGRLSNSALLVIGAALIANPRALRAQRGGGGGHNSMPVICVHDCSVREGMSSDDDLKDFRRVVALQATPDQRAAFAKIAQYTQAASDQLKNLSRIRGENPNFSVGRQALPGLITELLSTRPLRRRAPAARIFSARFRTHKSLD